MNKDNKKEYKKPELKVIGLISELTAAGSGGYPCEGICSCCGRPQPCGCPCSCTN